MLIMTNVLRSPVERGQIQIRPRLQIVFGLFQHTFSGLFLALFYISYSFPDNHDGIGII